MIHKLWQRWTFVAFLLSLSLLYSLDRASAQSSKLSSVERMKRDITFLASDECEGRGPGTKGLNKAADFIVEQFKEAGLKPGGVKGTWFQPFTIGGTARLDGKPIVKLQGPNGRVIELASGKEFQVMGLSASGDVSAPLVFAGYGTKGKDIDFDEYKDLDVAGKIVVVIRRVPRWNDKPMPFDGKNKTFQAGLENKLELARKHKAAAVILINDASEKNDKLLSFNQLVGGTPASIPAVAVSRAVLEPIFESSLKKPLADIEKAIDDDLKPLSAPLTGWTANIVCNVNRMSPEVKNVIGVVEGAGPLADETVVVGAHYDHLGYGGFGSLAPGSDAIHHGADDNASGTTSVLELARRFGARQNREGRRIVFMTFSAEERGLLGSRHYCNKEPLFPLEKTVAMINLDMVGRLSGDKDNKGGKLTVEGLGSSKGFEQLIDKFNEPIGFQLTKKKGSTPASDHASFYQKKIPIVFFFSGFHKEYHTPRDTSDLINVPGMKRIADLAEKVIEHVASDPQRPEFVAVPGGGIDKFGPGDPNTPRLGIRPDESDENKNGVTVVSVSAGGVAASAGVKSGDVIVELAGKQVKDLASYMKVMAAQKIGDTIEIGVMRDGNRVTLKALLK